MHVTYVWTLLHVLWDFDILEMMQGDEHSRILMRCLFTVFQSKPVVIILYLL